MLHHPPLNGSYNGLTIVLSNPSRFDKYRLLTSSGGLMFEQRCLTPSGIKRDECDIRVKEDKRDLLPNTKALLLLGESAMQTFIPETKVNHLGELRGSPLNYNGVNCIASYLPQEAVDIQKWEEKLNPLLNDSSSDDVEDGDDDGEDKATAVSEKRHHGKTSRKNWAFWLKKDVEKVAKLLNNNGQIPEEPKPVYKIYPSAEEAINILTNTKNETLYFDCETDDNLNFTCFSFSFGLPIIYIIPVVRHNYEWAYSRLPRIFIALAIAIRDNCLVAHNGASFDFFVLAHKYKIALGVESYDTMIAMHRCFPEVEKSLGHGTSLWTWQPFHKDEGNFAYGNEKQALQLWQYCGKDVYTMILIKQAIDRYAKTIPGLEASIKQGMQSIRPYLITSLQGIKYDEELRKSIVAENDRYCMQLLRMTDLLVGRDWIKKIRGTSKNPMLNSNNQCVRYFHDILGYPVVAESKKTGKPSLGKKNIYKLKLKITNPVLDIAIAYRETVKETGAINFTPSQT